jgi:type I restriction enzyme S subunit
MREMKDSGIDWIGEIPKKWVYGRIKYNTYLKGRIGWQGLKSEEFTDVGPNLVTGINFANDTVNWDSCYHITDERYNEAPEIQLQNDDLIMTKDGTIGKVAYINGLPGRASLNSHLLLIRPTTLLICNKYLFWLLKSNIFTSFYTYFKYGSIMDSISQEQFKNFNFYCPSTQYQQQEICAYLNSKCAQIDTILEKTKATIEEYKKLKQSVITEAVTKGLDPTVPMKNSGIEWIGKIPKQWKITKIKNLCSMKSGTNLISEQIDRVGIYPVYGGNGVRGFYTEYNTDCKCLIVGRQGALCGNVKLVNEKIWATEHAVITICSKSVVTEYFFYLLIAMDLNQYSISSAQPGLAVSQIVNLSTCYPPSEEEERIAAYINHKCSEIDTLIDKKQQLVTELESYKKSLIYECVTGKREVPTV